MGFSLFYFIGNSEFFVRKKKHMFTEHMLDRTKIKYDKKMIILENIKIFFVKIIIKFVII